MEIDASKSRFEKMVVLQGAQILMLIVTTAVEGVGFSTGAVTSKGISFEQPVRKSPHTTAPQTRQWCFCKENREKVCVQQGQLVTFASSSQATTDCSKALL